MADKNFGFFYKVADEYANKKTNKIQKRYANELTNV